MDFTLRNVAKLQKYTLAIIIVSCVVTFFIMVKLQYLPQVQFLTATILVMFYLMWALIHHQIDKSLNLEVVVEYVLIALLALVVLYGVIL